MNTEQLKTDVAKFIISKGVDNRNIMGPSGYLQLDDLLTGFASQESNKAVDDFKYKLKGEIERVRDLSVGDPAITSAYDNCIKLISLTDKL